MVRTESYRQRKVSPLAKEMVRLTEMVKDLEAKRTLVREQLVALMVKDQKVMVGDMSVSKAWREEYLRPATQVAGNWTVSVRKVSKKLGRKVS